MSIEIFQGSILDTGCEALINPANCLLQHRGGLGAVIQREAVGPRHLVRGLRSSDESPDRLGCEWLSDNTNGLVPTGSAFLGTPGHLRDKGFKGLIHAVGPIWGGGALFEFELLARAVSRALHIAHLQGYKSVALPAISAGIFGVPIDVVAQATLAAYSVWNHCFDRIAVALREDAHVVAFERELSKIRGEL